MSFIQELKRRNVFRVAIAYVITAWLVAQIADLVLDNIESPAWVMQTLMLVLALGFPFALIFAWAFELTPEGIKKEKDVDRSQSITSKTGRKLDYTIIAFLVIALGYFIWESRFDSIDTGVSEDAGIHAEAMEKSIAVLPFVNMSEDANNEYFSDGISEEILNALAKVNELQVAGRTSSFAFKGQNQDLRKIGEALGVNHILEGSVRKAGNKVRITAQLIQVDNGFHLWSESFDRELTDVFAIQDEIANAILVQLKAHLVDGESQTIVSARANSEAYDLYLLAKQRMYERTRLPLEAAAELLDRAIAIDPEYAPAYAQRGITTMLLSETQYGAIPDAQASTQSKLHIDQALRLDPNLAEGWAALGLYQYDRPGELKQGIAALEKALELNPGLIDASNWLNNAYITANQPAKSVALLEDVMLRDPLYRPGLANLAFLYTDMGLTEKASALIEKARPFLYQDVTIPVLDAMLLSRSGQIAQALAVLEKATLLQPDDRVARTQMSLQLLDTHQYERVAAEGYWWVKVIALRRLGRVEEASLLAQQWAGQGELESLFSLLNTTGQSAALVAYLEERWPDLATFAAAFPSNGYRGYALMNDVAFAYRREGNTARFDDAMARVRAAHDSLAEQGISEGRFLINEASYYALAGQRDRALEFLAAAVDRGRMFSSPISDDLPWFADFEGDPEYEAIQARMIEHLNRERAALGLEPIST